MRLKFLALLLSVFATGATAETFMGRSVQIVDGRTNRTGAAPLIVALHGFLGTPRSMRRKTQFEALARSNGLVVAYPEGIRRRWNDGRNPGSQVDDVAYLSSLIESLVAEGRVDSERVFVAGHSNGGGMAMRLACDRPDILSGIAVAATKSPTNYQCEHGRPIPAIFFHGTLDPIAPPQGRAKNDRLGGTLSADATLALWSARNRCARTGTAQIADRLDDGTSAKIIQYVNCHAQLVHVSIVGHGHAWPGAGPRLRRLQGPASREIDATALSWWFFSNL